MEVDNQSRIFNFAPLKIRSIKAEGNLRRDLKCPRARSGHRIVADNGNVFSFGGYNPHIDIEDEELRSDTDWIQSCPLFRELWQFNCATQTWRKLETKGYTPEELASHAAVLFNNNLFVFGGTGVPFGMSSSNKIYSCNLKSLEWNELKSSGDLPMEQYGQAMALDTNSHSLFVVGGTTGFDYSMDIHRYDLEQKEWTELKVKAKPRERYRHEIAIYDDKIFVFGGGTANASFGFRRIPTFLIKKQAWEETRTEGDPTHNVLQGYPPPRRCHGLVQDNQFVYVCGGHDGEFVFPDLWKLDLTTLRWFKMHTNLPTPVYFHSTALTQSGELFIFGGVTSIVENTRTNEMNSIWLKVPSLQEMAWQALQHYIPDLGDHKPEDLRAMGIPETFLSRVDFVQNEVIENAGRMPGEAVMP